MKALNSFCEKNFGILLIGVAIFAYFVPHIFLPLQNTADIMLMISLFCGFLKLNLSDIKTVGNNKAIIGLNLLIYLVLFPVATYFISALFLDPDTAAGMLLLFGVSSGVTCGFVASLLRLNIAWTTTITVLTSLFVPFTLPLLSKILLGTQMEISVIEMSLQMIKMIFIPALLAGIVNHLHTLKSGFQKIGPTLGTFSVVLFTPIFIAVFHEQIQEQLFTLQSLTNLIILFAMFSLRFILGYYVAFHPHDKTLSLSNSLNYGFMNNGIVMLIAAKYFGPQTFFFLLLSEIPWIIFQSIFARFVYKHQKS